MKIQQAVYSEIKEVAILFDLYRQFYEQPANLALAEAFIEKRIVNQESFILLARNTDGHAVGFCQLYPTFCSVIAAPIFSLYDLFVLPTERRNGTAKALLLAAADLARTKGMARMDLTTARTNTAAQALYESLGWQLDKVFLAYNFEVS